jgi:hypothetical protein
LIKNLVVAAAAALLWTQAEDASRELLAVPGIVARPGLASPTRSPWIVANGWRFMRHPVAKFRYEKHAYGADALLKIDPADTEALRSMTAFLDGLPRADLPPIADLGVVDDGTAITGEVMNLLARRNLLFEIVKAPSSRFPVNIAVGNREYPVEEAADPSAFALKIRRQLTDEQRTLRIYGSEVVIGRLTGDAARMRLHLINYAGRDIEALRVRIRGAFAGGDAFASGAGRIELMDHVVVADGATEFSLPRLGVYAVIDLNATR